MSGTILINVVLLPMSQNGMPPTYGVSFQRLTDWAQKNLVEVQVPFDRSEESLRFATVLATHDAHAEVIITELSGLPFIDAVYIKPEDEPPF